MENDFFGDAVVCETLIVGGKIFPDDFPMGGGDGVDICIVEGMKNSNGQINFSSILNFSTGINLSAGNIVIDSGFYSTVCVEISNVKFETHNGCFDLKVLTNGILVKDISVCGPGFPNPVYGFEKIFFQIGPSSTKTISVILSNMNEILNVVVDVKIFYKLAS